MEYNFSKITTAIEWEVVSCKNILCKKKWEYSPVLCI
jgi:hypothetical protein